MLDYDGFGALVHKTSTGEIRRASMAGAGLVRASLGDIPGAENVRRDLRGRLIADDQHLYHYDALDRLVAVQDRAEGKLIGRYTYNAFGERVSKTTTDGQGRHVTRQFLYQRSKLVAEIVGDEDGRVASRGNTFTSMPSQWLYSKLIASGNSRRPPRCASRPDGCGAACRLAGNLS